MQNGKEDSLCFFDFFFGGGLHVDGDCEGMKKCP